MKEQMELPAVYFCCILEIVYMLYNSKPTYFPDPCGVCVYFETNVK